VEFLKAVNESDLEFRDLHSENLMYDEEKERREPIDGSVIKKMGFTYHAYFLGSSNKISNYVIPFRKINSLFSPILLCIVVE
jgi:hypothetical protein